MQVDLFDVSDTYKVWSVLPEEDDVSMEKLPVNLSASEPVIFSVPDPRLPAFSHRLVLLQGIPGASTQVTNYNELCLPFSKVMLSCIVELFCLKCKFTMRCN